MDSIIMVETLFSKYLDIYTQFICNVLMHRDFKLHPLQYLIVDLYLNVNPIHI